MADSKRPQSMAEVVQRKEATLRVRTDLEGQRIRTATRLEELQSQRTKLAEEARAKHGTDVVAELRDAYRAGFDTNVETLLAFEAAVHAVKAKVEAADAQAQTQAQTQAKTA